MKALRSFTVRPKLPDALAPLRELAMNLRWSWHQPTRDLFRWVDPDQWEVTGHDPVRLLGMVRRERLETLAHDQAFLGFLREVQSDLQGYLDSDRWFQGRAASPLRHVAYFSPEFGIAEALPQYSGGLGVLAGDHLKAASGLGVPLVGVGLLYRQGYFGQTLNADGWQQERYPTLDPHAMALERIDGARVEVDLAGVPLYADIWRAKVGRVHLYLLDADIDENDPEGRLVTDRLYGGEREHRIRQEILLGVGGVRALHALGEPVQVFHTNEGHAGFLGLERVRGLIVEHGLSFGEAIEAVRAGTVFTTHTPVSAGIDEFERPLFERYFKRWTDECGVSMDELMALGHAPGADPTSPFNMAVMGLRLAGLSNGVARLHGETSRRMFQRLWPDVPADEVPITSVTNGVHAETWVSSEMADVLARYLTPAWHESAEEWARIDDIDDDELWRAREQGRDRLVAFVRERLRSTLRTEGATASDAAWADEVLDPRILTIGFARRFATYKRADLLLSQPDRLKALLLSPERPIQVVFAGKAHPADEAGKEMIRRIVQFSRDPEVRHRFAFVEDYDIAVARTLYQGSDVWLNTPRRPMEACGTSGEKAALNGALNCSILDGWWDEMFDGENGWAISSAEQYEDVARRDTAEAASLFEILERQIVPLFYDRSEGSTPGRWVQRVKASLRSLGPEVLASRMVREYVERLYEVTAAQVDMVSAGGFARARALAAWKARVVSSWDGVRVVDIGGGPTQTDLGAERAIEVVVHLGALTPDDVAVQLLHGPVGPNDELAAPMATVEMAVAGPADGSGDFRYAGAFTCEQAGRYGYTVRIVPSHADVLSHAELGCIAWA
jgi:starch phosphorylase